jgi:hypothetical protein
MWVRPDNQEVGLEAATLERVRNSSLVKWIRADNVAGLKRTAEAVAMTLLGLLGRGASCTPLKQPCERVVEGVGVRMQA